MTKQGIFVPEDERLEEISQREVDEIMNGPEPVLSPEEDAMLERTRKAVPRWIREWRAADSGALVIKDDKKTTDK